VAYAEGVRTGLVKEGFPTDRVELPSCQELGQVKLVQREGVSEKLTEYFRTLFRTGSGTGDRWVPLFQRAVLDGKAAVAVQPRGDIETQRALQLLNQVGAVELRGVDLQSQTLEHAATETETPIFTWIGKVLAAPAHPIPPVFRDYPEPIEHFGHLTRCDGSHLFLARDERTIHRQGWRDTLAQAHRLKGLAMLDPIRQGAANLGEEPLPVIAISEATAAPSPK
jgi:hypothetical protein